jgi:hypothetical protein
MPCGVALMRGIAVPLSQVRPIAEANKGTKEPSRTGIIGLTSDMCCSQRFMGRPRSRRYSFIWVIEAMSTTSAPLRYIRIVNHLDGLDRLCCILYTHVQF